MSDHVDIDPDELDRYIARLSDYIEHSREQMNRMLDACRALVYAWRDAAYGDYQDVFLRAMMEVERGVDGLEEEIPQLRRRSEMAHALQELP